VHDPFEQKPTLRGWIHAGTFPLAIVFGVVLLVFADGVDATWSSAVFVGSSLLLFGTSATYHRFDWSPRARVILKRFDHASIFVLIAGTYTPLSIMALPPDKGYLLLALVWSGALLGIGFRVFWISAPRWAYVPLYVLLGWAAVIYGMKRPNPIPGVFGFHETFHALTVVAFLCHWTGVFLLALDPLFGH
jgi:hemolysin III